MKLFLKYLAALAIMTPMLSVGQSLLFTDSSQSASSFRGMSIATDGSVWVSGSKGTIGKSIDNGKTWTWLHPAGFEKRDFRDIEAFSKTEALAMAVDSPGIILRTEDGGANWNVVYENHTPGVFLDALCFRNKNEGVCAGDPLPDGRLLIITTTNGGKTWQNLPEEQCPAVEKGEAMFAASGGNISVHSSDKHAFILVTGGMLSRLWTIYPFSAGKKPGFVSLPVKQGGQMTGANAVLVAGSYTMIPAGDYNEPARSDSNFAVRYKKRPPKLIELAGGYKSSLADNGEGLRVACGITGISMHEGPSAAYPVPWKVISGEPFHVVRNIPGTKTFLLAGSRGRMALLNFN